MNTLELNHFQVPQSPAMKLLLVVYGLFLLLACFVATALPVSGDRSNETDHEALLAFKAQITRDPLEVMSSWNQSVHFCHWQGVTCSLKHQRVAALDLRSQQLAGSIPPHLGNLSFLRSLDLTQNNFFHQIPPQLGNLFRLERLALENNTFNGSIPTNLSHCSNLVYLGLGGNNLTGQIPPEIGSLQKLQVLVFYKNHLSGSIPSSLGNLSSLRELSGTLNYLQGSIPSSVGQLKNLSFFAFGGNELSGTIPSSIYNLSYITLFSIPMNQFHGTLPPNLGLHIFPNIQKLNINGNYFSGQIPNSLANASNLLSIHIHNNNFSGQVPCFSRLHKLEKLRIFYNNLGNGQDDDLNFLSCLSNCTHLEDMSAMGNNFGGVLPKLLGNFSTKLRILALGGNRIRGSIPYEIGFLTSLKILSLQQNQLTGTIPGSLGQLHNVAEFSLNDNRLSGTIPSSLGNLTSVLGIFLMANSLDNSIPSSLGECKNLMSLDLSWNNLNGIIPKEVVSVSSLALMLDLSHNQLTGPLPSEVGNLFMLTSLDVSHNKLSGNIPTSLTTCTSLTTLHINNNFFQGTINQSLSSLRALDDLDLSTNNLSGQIPKYLVNFILLQNLNLSYNDFEGEVPTKGVFKNATIFSIKGNKRLCGGMPQLKLPSCSVQEHKKHKASFVVVTVICIVSGIIGLALLVFVFQLLTRKRKRPISSETLLDDFFMRLSFDVIQRATNGFSLANLIGRGSFGSVYKGVLEEDEKIVAVKVINLQLKGAFKSFMAECQALRNAKHRNLVKILTTCSSVDFQNNDFLALVYEYMCNGSLEECLHAVSSANEEPRCLNLGKRLDIAIDVACALNYLHHGCQTPIVHCDLKPSNVLIDGDMTARVGDFGLARLLRETTQGSSENQSNTIGLKGSIGYVSPEYGMGCEESTSGDVYSYGILLLEMFTGKRPTHDMFTNSLTLRAFVMSSLPCQLFEIVDPTLLVPIIGGENTELSLKINHDSSGIYSEKIRECLVSVLEVGIACSSESPSQRMDIGTVLQQLHQIRITLPS